MQMIRLIFASLTLMAGLMAMPVSLAAEKIPPKVMFGKSLVKNMKISPDGKHVALTYEKGTEVRLAVMRIRDRKILQGFEFGENQHVLNFWWGSDKRVVMSVGEVTGNLDRLGAPGAWYAADIDGKQRKEIFDYASSSIRMIDPLPDDERYVLVARYHFGDRGEPKANLLDIYTGEFKYLDDQPNDRDLRGLVADNDGVLRGAVAVKMGKTLDDIKLRLYVKSGDAWQEVEFPARRPRPNVNFLGFSKDNRTVYFASNHDMPENDRLGVFRYRLDSGEIEFLWRHEHVNVAGLARSPDGTVLGAYAFFGPFEYHLFDDQVEAYPEQAALLVGLINSHPNDNITVTSVTRDGTQAIVQVWGDRNPGEFFLFDGEKRQLVFLSESFPDIDKNKLVRMEPVRIKARDGLMLNAFLTRPADQKEKLPLIINVHGGPFGVFDTWDFNNEAQFFAQHGYATLQVNYRGSGNRGDDFQRAGWREWGGKMQDDLTDATRWAIEQGIADPDRICIYGGSYGGYASLEGVVKEPDLYRCAVGYVGVYDLVWFRKGDGSDFSQAGRMGGRENFLRFMKSAVAENPEDLTPVSPVHNVEKIKAELFIVHGGSDVRVPVGHAYRLREALDRIGKPYEWMIKEKEGHGFYDVGNRVDLYTAMLRFFDRHIGDAARPSAENRAAP